jgi:hypothetical protein
MFAHQHWRSQKFGLGTQLGIFRRRRPIITIKMIYFKKTLGSFGWGRGALFHPSGYATTVAPASRSITRLGLNTQNMNMKCYSASIGYCHLRVKPGIKYQMSAKPEEKQTTRVYLNFY